MEQILVNKIGKVRRATMNGRDYYVAEATSIVPGVLSGSRGSLYYPPEEIASDPSVWNHIPITIYHPMANGQHVSARDPDVLNSQGIGMLLRSKVRNKNLQHECWFDIESTRAADKRLKTNVLERLERGEQIELSTGLFTQNDRAPLGANHKGRPYDWIARNYKPDHLAVLPDQIGACSIKDGCGVLVNEQSADLRWNPVGNASADLNDCETECEDDDDWEECIMECITDNELVVNARWTPIVNDDVGECPECGAMTKDGRCAMCGWRSPEAILADTIHEPKQTIIKGECGCEGPCQCSTTANAEWKPITSHRR